MLEQRQKLEKIIVTAEQMRLIEGRIFEGGMPVAALMEKAAILCSQRIQQLYPLSNTIKVGILVGPGHNGGDALVIARELFLNGYNVCIYRPFSKVKELTGQHSNYASFLGISYYEKLKDLEDCDLIIDGFFGFGLTRILEGKIVEDIKLLNQWQKSVISVDLPSGLHTDTGEVLGIAVCATYSLCLGLWKLAYFQDRALPFLGKIERIDFGIPPETVWSFLSEFSPIQTPIKKMSKTVAKDFLPLPRPLLTYKYKQGHLLLICGSRRYAGGAILTGLGARASGVGMLSIAVPQSLKPLLVSHLPDAIIIDCPETNSGAISFLPPNLSLENFNVVACGPGLTTDNKSIIETILKVESPLILDADALNIIAEIGTIPSLSNRSFPTIITPHLGEFKRLFPDISSPDNDRISAAKEAANSSNSIVLFKGARTVIAHPKGNVWVVGESTPALARGGSGDVLTGLIGGLISQTISNEKPLEAIVATAAWWHSQAGILAATNRTELGVDAFTLSQYLLSKEILDF